MVWGNESSGADGEDRKPLLPKNNATTLKDEARNTNGKSISANSSSSTMVKSNITSTQNYSSISNPTQSSERGSSSSQGGTHIHGDNEETAPLMPSDRKVKPKMPWFDKRKRIILFIAVDCVFFLLEIITGYTFHSLALVADAFHMLNDIISLFIGLWAVEAAQKRASSLEYTYGWVRSEILGGFANGVFLIALCLNLILESIKKFVQPESVSNPKAVLIVGAIGLASNILGLLVFHQHSHSHGEDDGHDHGQDHENTHDTDIAGKVHPNGIHIYNGKPSNRLVDTAKEARKNKRSKAEDVNTGVGTMSALTAEGDSSTQARPKSIAGRSRSRHQTSLSVDIVHPASVRNEIIQQAGMREDYSDSDESDDNKVAPSKDTQAEAEDVGLSISHHDHLHRRPKKVSKQGHSHSHQDMNIRGIFLHVIGDALGNVAVMASALIIWKTNWSLRQYADPFISLFITIIILLSAVPLVKSAGRSLLQATPRGVSVDEIRQDILTLPKVLGCHHLHVWALTAQKRVASLDVKLDVDIAKDPKKYMELIREIKQCLREHGVHSSTIQPEFNTSRLTTIDTRGAQANSQVKIDSNDGLGLGACLLDDEEYSSGKQCCTPRNGLASAPISPHVSDEEHGHGHHDHSHH